MLNLLRSDSYLTLIWFESAPCGQEISKVSEEEKGQEDSDKETDGVN